MINTRDYQTIIIHKDLIARIKLKLQKRTRAPLVKIMDFAVCNVLDDEQAEEKFREWLDKEAV